MAGKLKIDPEQLSVVSFDTMAAGRGAVVGQIRVTYTDPRLCEPSFDWYCSEGDRCTWPEYGC